MDLFYKCIGRKKTAFTYFFRDLHTLELTVKHIFPIISGRSNIRIWDAGCAMGQEPYTLAILLAENMGRFVFKNLHIDATDIDGSNLFEEIIVTGLYPKAELERIPRELFKKYFQKNGKPDHFQIVELLRNRLHYQKHDLLTLKPAGKDYSLIVCKNVLLHIKYKERIEVIRMFYDVLLPGGFFATEQTQKLPEGLSNLFEQTSADGQIFRKVG